MSGTRTTQIVAAILLCSLISACKPGFNSRTAQELAINLAAPYDYYIVGMRTLRFAPDGKALFQLNAGKVTHFASDDHAELTDPILHWYRSEAAPWRLSAARGNLHHAGDAEELTLTDGVNANTMLAQGGPLLLETTTLNILPDQKLARTEADVKISTASLRMKGSGLQLNLTDNTIAIPKDVRGTYAQ